jgi:hypothetical protein
MRPWILTPSRATLRAACDATHARWHWRIIPHGVLRVLGLRRSIPVKKYDADLRDDDDWINAEVDSDRTPRFLAEFRAWTRMDEPTEEVAQAVKWGWPVPSSTVH